MSNTYIGSVRDSSTARYNALRNNLVDAKNLLGKMGCVYATGSFGRLEAGPSSDLDLFVVVKSYKRDDKSDDPPKFRLRETKQILLKRELIVTVEKAGFQTSMAEEGFLKLIHSILIHDTWALKRMILKIL